MNKFLFTAAACLSALAASAQQGPVLTDKDYAHAESFLNYGTEPFIDHAVYGPTGYRATSFGFVTLIPAAVSLFWSILLKKPYQACLIRVNWRRPCPQLLVSNTKD